MSLTSLLRHRHLRRLCLVVADLLIIAGSYWLAYWLRQIPPGQAEVYRETMWQTLPFLLVVRLLCGALARQYTWSFRLASLAEAANVALATGVGTVLFFLICHFSEMNYPPPRSIYIMEFGLSLLGMLFVRFLPRYLIQQYLYRSTRLAANGDARTRTIILGAGSTGEMILRDLTRTGIYPYHIVGFVDDNPAKLGASIHGRRVLGTAEDLPRLAREHRVDKLLVAVPGIAPSRLREIVDLCAESHLRFKIVPPYAQLVAKGEAAPITLKDVRLEDLLERPEVEFDHTRLAEHLVGRTALVTGAAGSIGSEICRQIARHGIKAIVLFDLNENDLYFLQMELAREAPRVELAVEIGSVRDPARLAAVFGAHRPALVFHAAAHKHVPLVERCPAEGLKNNVLGTQNVAAAADAAGVERFVLISTDKAVAPTNVMGASKHLAELVVRDLAQRSRTQFRVVRFGNVLGSNGSLAQILQRQIRQGGPVTITHPRITRYFMTIPEAVGLVIVAGLTQESGLCVLDMGEPLSVDRLAREMIALAGLVPDRDIEIVYTGLRPGEKMYEEPVAAGEERRPTAHPRIYAVEVEPPEGVETMLQEVRRVAEGEEKAAVSAFLRRYVAGYAPPSGSGAESPAGGGTGSGG